MSFFLCRRRFVCTSFPISVTFREADGDIENDACRYEHDVPEQDVREESENCAECDSERYAHGQISVYRLFGLVTHIRTHLVIYSSIYYHSFISPRTL